MPAENKFQSDLIKELQEDIFPESIVLKNDANYLQGFPDLTILFEDTWAVLESKSGSIARRRPNQEYYIKQLNKMSFARFIYPGNREKVLDELQQALRLNRTSRFLRR